MDDEEGWSSYIVMLIINLEPFVCVRCIDRRARKDFVDGILCDGERVDQPS
jgi:hypothetical protein